MPGSHDQPFHSNPDKAGEERRDGNGRDHPEPRRELEQDEGESQRQQRVDQQRPSRPGPGRYAARNPHPYHPPRE